MYIILGTLVEREGQTEYTTSSNHPEFFQHYGSILVEDHFRSGLPQTLPPFRETLQSRCPYLTDAERASILASLETEVPHTTN